MSTIIIGIILLILIVLIIHHLVKKDDCCSDCHETGCALSSVNKYFNKNEQ